jgi:anthranilate phosphoribosyltransferase
MIKDGIQNLVHKIDLSHEESKTIMTEIMSGNASQAQIGAFLAALRMKGETPQEISAFAHVMREFCHRIRPHTQGRILDIVGTGGDPIKTFNISTLSAIVAAGAGITVAKHGNRSVTSSCGSADVLEKLGYNLELSPSGVERIISNVGIGFMFAPKFHPAMKHAIGPRREIGIRSVFNILGPLTNPANANAIVMGVFYHEWLAPLAQVLQKLGCEEAMVVHGMDGLDEISTLGSTTILWLRNDEITTKTIHPQDFGFDTAKPEDLQGKSPDANAHLTFQILKNQLPPNDHRTEIVLLNAAAGIVVAGIADSFSKGIDLAKDSLVSGRAYNKLKQMIRASNGDQSKLEELEQQYG